MNNLYEHKARKYKYKYLKLLGEYVGGFERCSQEHLVSLLDNENKLSPEKHNLYKNECNEEKLKELNNQKNQKQKTIISIEKQNIEKQFNKVKAAFDQNQDATMNNIFKQYQEDKITEDEMNQKLSELRLEIGPQIKDFSNESKSGAKVSFQQSGPENPQTGSVIQQGPAQRQQNFLPQGQQMIPQNLHLEPAQRGNFGLSQGQPMIPQGPPIPPQGYLPENFNPQTGLMNPQLQAQSAPPQTGNFSSYGNFTNYLSQPGVGVGANFGRGYQ